MGLTTDLSCSLPLGTSVLSRYRGFIIGSGHFRAWLIQEAKSRENSTSALWFLLLFLRTLLRVHTDKWHCYRLLHYWRKWMPQMPLAFIRIVSLHWESLLALHIIASGLLSAHTGRYIYVPPSSLLSFQHLFPSDSRNIISVELNTWAHTICVTPCKLSLFFLSPLQHLRNKSLHNNLQMKLWNIYQPKRRKHG